MRAQAILICFSLIFLTLCGAVIAQDDYPEVIEFDGSVDGGRTDDIHPSTYTGPVSFQHARHIEQYAAGCGDCHHDGDYEPVENYDPDESYSCADCHDGEGLIRGTIAMNSSTADDLLEHRANVLHTRCIGCHKKYNAEQHVVTAPEACRICHAKQAQEWVVK